MTTAPVIPSKTVEKRTMYKSRTKNYQKLSVAERKIDHKERRRKNKKLFRSLKEGQCINGKVHKIEAYGAVIEYMGIFGFLHISEISDKWVDHPKNFLKIGQRFRLKILSKNNARMSLKLSRKQVDLDHRKEITIQG